MDVTAAPRWVQVPEPAGVVFYGVVPSTRRVWLRGQLQPWHPEDYQWELEQLRISGEQRSLVCVDLEPRYNGLYFEGDPGQYWWQTSHFRNLFWDDLEFAQAVRDADCAELPAAVEGPERPLPEHAWTCAVLTSNTTYAFSNAQKHPGKDRFAARKGWRRG